LHHLPGTTGTALLASLVSSSPAALQLALCHLLFNVFGILIWYPVPCLRRVPLRAASTLGALTRRYKSAPLIYIALAFFIIPLLLLGLSTLFEEGHAFTVLGVIIAVALALGVLWFVFWWTKRDGRSTVSTFLDRHQQHQQALRRLPETLEAMQEKIKLLEIGARGHAHAYDAHANGHANGHSSACDFSSVEREDSEVEALLRNQES
jgi:sodium-dependent phosphate cotransporter